MLWKEYIIMNKNKSPIKLIFGRFRKILLFWLIIFWLFLVFSPNVVYAESMDSLLYNEMYARQISQFIEMISHVVYVFIWPFLTIAGAALDNSLIYGKFLHLDAALWSIRNIMKNIANFTLCFLFIFAIVKNLFAGAFWWKVDPMKNAVDTIKSTLLAWVLVQMSWFLVSILIDLSTVLIYSVWWVPLSYLWLYSHDTAVMPVLELNVEMDESSSFSYYSYWWKNFAPCFLVNKWGDVRTFDNATLHFEDWKHAWEYIAWRKRLYMTDGAEFEPGYCTLNGRLYSYNESSWLSCLSSWGSSDVCYEESGSTVSIKNEHYFSTLRTYLNNLTWENLENQINSCFLISAYGIDYTWSDWSECERLCSDFWELSYTGDYFSNNDWLKLENVIDKSKWFVWPFITMYSSILNYQDLVIDPGNNTTMWNLFGFILNTFFALVLFIPIAILAVLLIIRVWYLWIVVALSPILVLVYCFWKSDGPLKTLKEDVFKKFGLKEVMMQIFSPVIVVFAVSLCIVFLSTIYKTKPLYEDASDVLSWFWIEPVWWTNSSNTGGSTGLNCIMSWWLARIQTNKSSYSILWLVTVKLDAQNYNHDKDIFVWSLMMLLSTWIVRFFMKFAIWMMGDRWKNLMKSAEEFITSIPIIPLPGWHWAVWINRLKKLWPTEILNRVTSENSIQSEATLRKAFPWAFPWGANNDQQEGTPWSVVSTESVDKVVKEINDNRVTKYDDLSDESKTTLTSMYGSSAANYYSDFFTKYYITNKNEYTTIVSAWQTHKWTPTAWKTNADALQFTRDQLNTAVKSDPNWISWARWMVAWSVQTREWVFMVDIVEWTENHPIYEILKREEYEKRHFGNHDKPIDKIDKTTYEANQAAINKYLDELKEELARLGQLERDRANWQLGDNQNLYDRLSELKRELEWKDFAVEEIRQYLGLWQ